MTRVVIIGGGAIGCATAYFLLSDPKFGGTVTVVERDPTYSRASSALSASSIRVQFSTGINIELGRFGVAFLREADAHLAVDGATPGVRLVEPGYLFLATEAGVPILELNHRVQRIHGVDVALFDARALRERFPWLATGDIEMGSLGLSEEGWFDGYTLLQGFRRKAQSLGARFVHAEAVGFETAGDRVEAVRLADGTSLPSDAVVNAAGPWAARVAGWLGVDLPVRPRRRSVFTFTCPSRIDPCPLVIDPSGVWFRPEGRGFICGVSPDAGNDPDEPPLDVEHALFESTIWPALARRVPAFEALRVTGGWAGYYDYNTFDQNGIVGPHPAWGNVIFANGFSGHGIQQSPGVGRGVAELVAHGAYRSLDLAPLGFDRIPANRPLTELNVI